MATFGRRDECEAVRVLIADSSPLFRSGIRRSIENQEGFDIVGEAEALPRVISLAEQEKPEVIILGISGYDSLAWEAVCALARCSSVLVVIHVDGRREALANILKVFQAGAVGCIDRMAREEELTHAVKTVALGRLVVSSVVAKTLVEELLRSYGLAAGMGKIAACAEETSEAAQSPPVEDVGMSHEVNPGGRGKCVLTAYTLHEYPHVRGGVPESLLTAREIEVLTLLAGGETNRAIAGQLSISEKTVKNHVSSILRRLGVAGRTEAAVWAVRRGFPTGLGRPTQDPRPNRNET